MDDCISTKSVQTKSQSAEWIPQIVSGSTGIGRRNKIKAVDIEFGLPKPSYTINTLTYLQEKYPDHEFGVIMGSDSLHNLDRWKNAELIMKNFPLYVYERQGYPMRDDLDDATIIDMKAPLLNISSSLVRRMLKEGKSIRYLVPDTVNEEIQKGNYYR